MPDKPLWIHRLPEILGTLERLSVPWVDRSMVEDLLQVRRRRAQLILAPLATHRKGCSTVVERTALMRHLERIASGEAVYYEQRRRERLWKDLENARNGWLETPPVFIQPQPEVVAAAYKKDFEGLPQGVELAPGRIQISFEQPAEALEKLLALAIAIGQNQAAFEEKVQIQLAPGSPLPA